jgi:hypothetical protein
LPPQSHKLSGSELLMLTEQRLEAFFNFLGIGWSFLLGPLIVLVVSFRVLRDGSVWVTLISTTFFTFSALVFSFFLPLQWIWRDGLGPVQ